MKFIDSNYEIIPQEPGLLGVYKQIEKAARTSYKSEDKITEDSAKKMVDILIKNHHYACLEHGTIYLEVPMENGDWVGICGDYDDNPYSKVQYVQHDSNTMIAYITTNARVLIENDWLDDLKYMCEPTEYHAKRVTVKFITSIGITREILRHRVFSFMNESTRWCNYSKGKFGSELTFVIPQWIYDCRNEHASYIDPLTRVSRSWLIKLTGEELVDSLCTIDRTVSSYCDVLEKIEAEYNFDVVEPDGYKLKPEEARGMLPMDTKSELVMTGFIDDWIGFFLQRSYFSTTGRPHPDIQKLADLLMLDFLDRGFITNAQINRIKDEVYKKQVFEESS